MIERERLEELIKQSATIYQVYVDATIIKMKLDKDFKVDNAHLCKKLKGVVKSCGYPLYKLFETLEGAEWYKEFGCIERTEKLELPTWEEFLKAEKYFLFKAKNSQNIFLFRENNTIYIEDEKWNILREELTKENYILACRKAKELFLGE